MVLYLHGPGDRTVRPEAEEEALGNMVLVSSRDVGSDGVRRIYEKRRVIKGSFNFEKFEWETTSRTRSRAARSSPAGSPTSA